LPWFARHADLLHHNLLDPLDADVFVLGLATGPAPGTDTTWLRATLAGLLDRTRDFRAGPLEFDLETRTVLDRRGRAAPHMRHKWGRLVLADAKPQLDGAALESLLRSEKRNETLLGLLVRDTPCPLEGACKRTGSAYEKGAEALGPALARQWCLDAIRAREKRRTDKTGWPFRYDAVIWTRALDTVYFEIFPPIREFLDPQNTVFVAGEVKAKDEWAIVPRHMADWFLSQWEYLANGTMDTSLGKKKELDRATLFESFLETRPVKDWKVARMSPTTFARACCTEERACPNSDNVDRDVRVSYARTVETRRFCQRFGNESRWLDIGANQQGWNRVEKSKVRVDGQLVIEKQGL
jgi:hypothetical protein